MWDTCGTRFLQSVRTDRLEETSCQRGNKETRKLETGEEQVNDAPKRGSVQGCGGREGKLCFDRRTDNTRQETSKGKIQGTRTRGRTPMREEGQGDKIKDTKEEKKGKERQM